MKYNFIYISLVRKHTIEIIELIKKQVPDYQLIIQHTLAKAIIQARVFSKNEASQFKKMPGTATSWGSGNGRNFCPQEISLY